MQLWYYRYLSDSQKRKIAYLVWHGLIDPDQLKENDSMSPMQLEAIKFAKDCKRQMRVKEY